VFYAGSLFLNEKLPMTFYAHSKNAVDKWHPLKTHLSSVSALAGKFSGQWLGREEAELAGLLHDLGKYGERFQNRLRGNEQGLDHWSQGAWLALREHQSVAAAAAIQGHHIGLQPLSKEMLSGLNPTVLQQAHPLNLRLSESNYAQLKQRLEDDGLAPQRPKSLCFPAQGGYDFGGVAKMLDVRRVFSALVDADFLDTEAHFQGTQAGKYHRPASPDLEPAKALQILEDHLAQLNQDKQHAKNTDAELLNLREDLRVTCLQAAEQPPGLFTLTAPTGSGKTLAMLAFALRHAAKHKLRRVVMVIPYLSIIEQTAKVYRELFAPHFGVDYVLEHHSLAEMGASQVEGVSDDNSPNDEDHHRRHRLQAENWDAPLIVTTSVQALESLFAHRPAACRKLHRLAESVILFDEVQTLPVSVIVPTLGALSHIAHNWRSSVVFATATQPAFEHLAETVEQHSVAGWQPQKIVPTASLKPRVHYQWPAPDEALTWPTIAEQLATETQVLCIVNLKRHAQALVEQLVEGGVDGVFHLSTNMCAAHRTAVLNTVRQRLETQQPCRLISTQCVEAGVDIDFPTVWRAMGPLDAIIQAAGRCNRYGVREQVGQVRIFLPADAGYPPGIYRQASAVTSVLLNEAGGALDLYNPAVIQHYYRRLYDLTTPENQSPELVQAIKGAHFPDVATRYRIINQDTINVLVCYAAQAEAFERLRVEANDHGLKREWIASARAYSVSLYRPKPEDPVWGHLSPINQFKRGRWQTSEDWFIAQPGDYSEQLGLLLPDGISVYIA